MCDAFDLKGSKTETQIAIAKCMNRAKEYLRAGNFAGSIVWLHKCVELAPNDAAHHATLARSLSKVPQYRDEASLQKRSNSTLGIQIPIYISQSCMKK
jgi:Flp pilus assembly protein TadD